MKTRSLRFRMMLLFCAVVSLLLAASYLAFLGLLAHEIYALLDFAVSPSTPIRSLSALALFQTASQVID